MMLKLGCDREKLRVAQRAPLYVLPVGGFFYDRDRHLVCIVRAQDKHTTLVEPWYDTDAKRSLLHYDGRTEVTSCTVKMLKSDYVAPLSIDAALMSDSVWFSADRFYGESGQLPAFMSAVNIVRQSTFIDSGLYVRRKDRYERIGALPATDVEAIKTDDPRLSDIAIMYSHSLVLCLVPAIQPEPPLIQYVPAIL